MPPSGLVGLLPLCPLRLLKPCKVKRFLTEAALSYVGLVTASSGPGEREEKKREGRKEEGGEEERGVWENRERNRGM